MRILVMGAGVVGVTTAWALARDGHEVTVVDRAAEAASFTSFANAGLVAPGHAYAWASPRAPGLMWRSLWRGDQAIRFRPQFSPAFWGWVRRFVGQCTAERAAANTAAKLALCRYSQSRLDDLVAQTGVTYDGRSGGLIYFYRTQASFDAGVAKSQLLRDGGVPIEVLDRDQTVARDPGLAAARDQIAGSLFAATDASGDARLFTQALARVCEAEGVAFRWGEEVLRLDRAGGEIAAAITSRGRIEADAYVLCLGVFSPGLVRDLGIRLPVWPVRGYSATLPVSDPEAAPRIGGVDEDNLLAYCPMGSRLRLTATAEIAGYDTSHRPGDFADMLAKGRALFGAAADFDTPQLWVGLRPMTPTGLPVIDRASMNNLWLNTGHGHMGWTMSAGSAKILADLIGQRQPEIDRKGVRLDDHR